MTLDRKKTVIDQATWLGLKKPGMEEFSNRFLSANVYQSSNDLLALMISHLKLRAILELNCRA